MSLWMRRTRYDFAVLDVLWKVRHELRWGGLGQSQSIADIMTMTTSGLSRLMNIGLLLVAIYRLFIGPSTSNVLIQCDALHASQAAASFHPGRTVGSFSATCSGHRSAMSFVSSSYMISYPAGWKCRPDVRVSNGSRRLHFDHLPSYINSTRASFCADSKEPGRRSPTFHPSI